MILWLTGHRVRMQHFPWPWGQQQNKQGGPRGRRWRRKWHLGCLSFDWQSLDLNGRGTGGTFGFGCINTYYLCAYPVYPLWIVVNDVSHVYTHMYDTHMLTHTHTHAHTHTHTHTQTHMQGGLMFSAIGSRTTSGWDLHYWGKACYLPWHHHPTRSKGRHISWSSQHPRSPFDLHARQVRR